MRHPMPTNARPARLGAGIGLLMMLIVVGIGLSMMFGGFGGKSYMQTVNQGRKQGIDTAAEISTQQLTTCIMAYKLSNNKLPQTPEELDCGPLLDPWKRPMTFTYKTEKGGSGEIITVIWRSAGPDANMNTSDDIVKEDRLQG